jgi:hypothetical protein
MRPEHCTIFILSHFFTPHLLISAKRASYLATYLSEHGYNVIVLKAHNQHYAKDHIGQSNPPADYQVRNICLPSSSAGMQSDRLWYQAYKKEIGRLLPSKKACCLYMSGNPFFYFALGKCIKKKYGVSYLLDFRDPWYQDRRLHHQHGSLVDKIRFYRSSFLDRIRERQSVQHAAYVINVTRKRTDIYRRYYKRLDPQRFITIPNGYDETQVPAGNSPANHDDGCLKVGIFGKFGYYSHQHVDLLIEASRKLPESFQCVFHHWGDVKFDAYLTDQVQRQHVAQRFCFHGQEDYKAGMRELGQMDCLLINNRDIAHFPTKIYDYIWLNKPVVALLAPGSELGGWLKRFRHAYQVQTASELSDRLTQIARFSIRQLDPEIDKESYSRRAAADQLLPYLHNVLAMSFTAHKDE